MKIFLYTISILYFFTLFSSCNIINPKEDIPTYIKIDAIKIKDANGNLLTSNVQTVFVYYQNSSKVAQVGVFKLPCIVPVLLTEAGTITLQAGVYYDGMVGTTQPYPLYNKININVNPSPTDTINIDTTYTTYISSLNTVFSDDLETGTNMAISTADSFATWTRENTIVCSGSFSGLFEMHLPDSEAFINSTSNLVISTKNNSYIEFDYLSDIDFELAMLGFNPGANPDYYSLLGLKKQSNWKHMYIYISDDIRTMNDVFYKLILRMRFLNNESSGKIYLDNIKIYN